MPLSESLYPKDWLSAGQKDYKRAEILLGSGDYEGAGFHLQQAIEKYLKGYLLSQGWKLKRIHDLEALLNAALAFNKDFERFRSLCARATNYYLEERYPYLMPSAINKDELESVMHAARELITIIT